MSKIIWGVEAIRKGCELAKIKDCDMLFHIQTPTDLITLFYYLDTYYLACYNLFSEHKAFFEAISEEEAKKYINMIDTFKIKHTTDKDVFDNFEFGGF